MRILILGASGQIGFPLLQRLSHSFPQAQIVGTSRSGLAPGPLASNANMLGFDPFSDDWEVLRPCDWVYNCIGQIRESKTMPFQRIHAGLTELLLANREKLGQPRIMQLSALGAGRYPDIPFLATKAEADRRLLLEPDTVVIRPSIVWTPDTMLLRKLRQLYRMSRWLGGRVIVPQGFLQSTVQPIEIDDLTALMIAVGEGRHAERIVSAVGPEPMSFGALLEEVAGKPLPAWEIPRKVLEPLIRYIVSPLMPQLINYDQFRLLFEDNIP